MPLYKQNQLFHESVLRFCKSYFQFSLIHISFNDEYARLTSTLNFRHPKLEANFSLQRKFFANTVVFITRGYPKAMSDNRLQHHLIPGLVPAQEDFSRIQLV